MYLVGRCYFVGFAKAKGQKKGVAAAQKEGTVWYRKAAEKGLAAAQDRLGEGLRDGLGEPRDIEEAARWFARSAEQNYPRAHAHLAEFHLNGLGGVPRDRRKAYESFKKGGEGNDLHGLSGLTNCYRHGWGVKKNPVLELETAKKAAQAGHPSWQVNLGDRCLSGKGVPRNDKQGLAWYRKAAKEGHAQGRFSVGWCYENGRGVARDLDEAITYYRLAAAQRHGGALKALARLGVEK
jgi:TPR repeat protein